MDGLTKKDGVKKLNYSSYYKKQELQGRTGGRSDHPEVTYCAAPPILKSLIKTGKINELVRNSRAESHQKNRQVSAVQRRAKELRRDNMLTKHS